MATFKGIDEDYDVEVKDHDYGRFLAVDLHVAEGVLEYAMTTGDPGALGINLGWGEAVALAKEILRRAEGKETIHEA